MTYPPEDFAPEDDINHRAARCTLSAFAVVMVLFVIPFITTLGQAAVLTLCGTVAALIMIGDAIWVIKWLISQHTSRRDNNE